MRVRIITAVLTALAAAAGLTATAPSPATAAAADPAVSAERIGATPGAGWFLAVVSKGRRTEYGIITKLATLELVSPTGERAVVYSHAVTRKGLGYFTIIDWTTDGRTVLLAQSVGEGQQAVAVDVATGAQRSVALPVEANVSLLAPDGSGVLVSGYGTGRGSPLSLLTWGGVQTPVARVLGKVIAVSPSTVMGGTAGRRAHSLDVIDLTSHTVVRRISTPGLRCDPLRSWDATQTLLTCYDRRYTAKLYLVTPATGALLKLSKRHPAADESFGDLDARVVDSGLYLQVAGPCGVVDIARQRANGSLERVEVPKSVGNVLLVGAEGSRLIIQHAMSCDGPAPRAVLSRYNPVTGRERVIAQLRGRESFDRVLPFGESQASLY